MSFVVFALFLHLAARGAAAPREQFLILINQRLYRMPGVNNSLYGVHYEEKTERRRAVIVLFSYFR
jgi:hypothetical protein